MPIRFRCEHCNRLLGIARRKAGTQINCPQCARPVTVPVQEELPDLNDLEDLNEKTMPLNGMPLPAADPAESTQRFLPDAGRPTGPAVAAKPAPVPAKPPSVKTKKPRRTDEEQPLFEQDDFDAMLGMNKPGEKLDLDDEPAPRARPVSGMDANNLESGERRLVLSSQKATILIVAVVVLLAVAFAAGFLIASTL